MAYHETTRGWPDNVPSVIRGQPSRRTKVSPALCTPGSGDLLKRKYQYPWWKANNKTRALWAKWAAQVEALEQKHS